MTSADSERDEWLLDESLKETFPASDSTSPVLPGSLLGMRYTAKRHAAQTVGFPRTGLLRWLLGALIGGVIVGVIVIRGRHS